MHSKNIQDVRDKVDLFYTDMRNANSITYIEDALCDLKDLDDDQTTPDSTKEIIANILDRLYSDIQIEGKRIIKIKPLPSLDQTNHWIEVMKSFKACGWESPQDFKDTGIELLRVKRIINDSNGHISKELHKLLFDIKPEDLGF